MDKSQLASLHFKINLIGKYFSRWKEFAVKENVEKNRRNVARIFNEEHIHRYYFRIWFDHFKKRKKQNEIKMYQLKQYVFKKWLVMVVEKRIEDKRKEEIARKFHTEFTLNSFFKKWRDKMMTRKLQKICNYYLYRRVYNLWKLKLLKRKLQRKLAKGQYNKKLLTRIFVTWRESFNISQEDTTRKNLVLNLAMQRIYFSSWRSKLEKKQSLMKISSSLVEFHHFIQRKYFFGLWKHQIAIKRFTTQMQEKHLNYLKRKYGLQWKGILRKKRLKEKLEIAWPERKNFILIKSSFKMWIIRVIRKKKERELIDIYQNTKSANIMKKTWNIWSNNVIYQKKERLLTKIVEKNSKKQFLVIWRRHLEIKISENIFTQQNLYKMRFYWFVKWRESSLERKVRREMVRQHQNNVINNTLVIWKEYCCQAKQKKFALAKTYFQYWLGSVEMIKIERLQLKLMPKWSNLQLKKFFSKWKKAFIENQTRMKKNILCASNHYKRTKEKVYFNTWKKHLKLFDTLRLYHNSRPSCLQQNMFTRWKISYQLHVEQSKQDFLRDIELKCSSRSLDKSRASRPTTNSSSKDAHESVNASGMFHGCGEVSVNHNQVGVSVNHNQVGVSATHNINVNKAFHTSFLRHRFFFVPSSEDMFNHPQSDHDEHSGAENKLDLKLLFMKRIVIYWKNLSISRYFYDWLVYVKKQRFLLHLQYSFKELEVTRRKKHLFSVWKVRCIEAKKAIQCRRTCLLKNTLSIWCFSLSTLKHYQCMERTARDFQYEYTLKVSWRKWHKQMKLRRNVRGKYARWKMYCLSNETEHDKKTTITIQNHRILVVLGMYFSDWKKNLEKQNKAKVFLKNAIKKRYFMTWLEFTHECTSSVIFTHKRRHNVKYEKQVLETHFGIWCTALKAHVALKKRLNEVKKCQDDKNIRDVFYTWVMASRMSEKRACVVNLFLQRRVLYAWDSYVKIRREFQIKLIGLREEKNKKVLHNFFITWKRKVEFLTMEKMFLRNKDLSLYSAIFQKWKNAANTRKFQRISNEQNIRMIFNEWRLLHEKVINNRHIEMFVFYRWKGFVKKTKANVEKCETLLEKTSFKLITHHYKVWKLRQVQLNQARNQFQMRTLSRCFETWKASAKGRWVLETYVKSHHEYQCGKKLKLFFKEWRRRRTEKRQMEQSTYEIIACKISKKRLLKTFFTFWKENYYSETFRRKRTRYLLKKYSTRWRETCCELKMVYHYFDKEVMRMYWCSWRLRLVRLKTIKKIEKYDQRKLLRNVLIKWSQLSEQKQLN